MGGAQKRTRTSTPLRAPAPEAGASTNSAIWATARCLGGWAQAVNAGIRGLQLNCHAIPPYVPGMSIIELDLKGLKCPLPALKTRKALKSMSPGATLVGHLHRPDGRHRHPPSRAGNRRSSRCRRAQRDDADLHHQPRPDRMAFWSRKPVTATPAGTSQGA